MKSINHERCDPNIYWEISTKRWFHSSGKKDHKLLVPSPVPSVLWQGTLELTHTLLFSQRIGHEAPGVVVCPLYK